MLEDAPRLDRELIKHFDTIVIGSGIGGLTTAAILSRVANKKVLVLEQHYEIGGLTHEFRREPFSFRTSQHVRLAPGQHMKVEVARNEWRAYSLEKISADGASLLVDTKHGGPGSKFMKSANEGDSMCIRVPRTDFEMPTIDMADSKKDILFFATSLGISLIISVLQELEKQNYKGKLKMFFGAPSPNDIFIEPLVAEYVDKLNLEVVYCVDTLDKPADKLLNLNDETISQPIFQGNVVQAFEATNINAIAMNHYVCGNPFMVQTVIHALHNRGANNIYW